MTRRTRSTSVQYFGLSPEIRRRLIRTFWYRPRCSLPPEAGKLAGSLGSTASTASSRFWAAKCSSPFIPPDLRNSSVEVIFYGYLLRLITGVEKGLKFISDGLPRRSLWAADRTSGLG